MEASSLFHLALQTFFLIDGHHKLRALFFRIMLRVSPLGKEIKEPNWVWGSCNECVLV